MWTSFHTAVGVILLALPLPPVLTVPGAFLSHHVVDVLGESSEGSSMREEAVLAGVQLGAGVLSGKVFEVLAGGMASSGMDLIDKFLGPIIGLEPNTVFECHRPGFKTVPVDSVGTRRANILGTGFAASVLILSE